MQGRKVIVAGGHQLSVLVDDADFRALGHIVDQRRSEQPGYSFGDLLRSYIRRSLEAEPRIIHRPKLDTRQDQVRRLHAIAHSATKLAREVGKTA